MMSYQPASNSSWHQTRRHKDPKTKDNLLVSLIHPTPEMPWLTPSTHTWKIMTRPRLPTVHAHQRLTKTESCHRLTNPQVPGAYTLIT